MVADDAITYAKIQNVSADERILGRISGANGVIEELTKAQVLTFANVADGADVTTFTLAGDGGSNQTITAGNTLTVAGGNGITTAGAATDTINVAVDAAQTTITSILAADLKIGEDDQTKIDFETADQINFYANNVHQLTLNNGALITAASSGVTLGTADKEVGTVYSAGLVTTGAVRQRPVVQTAASPTNLHIPCESGNYHELTLGNGDVDHVDFTGATAGQRIVVRFKNHSTAKNLSSSEGWNSIKVNGSSATDTWAGGIIPTLTDTDNAVDVYGFIFQDTVTNVMGFIIGQDVKA
tara:strand:- start:90 stop:983 length:894 start_codon:yes stop_codon:yes gene_type:complete